MIDIAKGSISDGNSLKKYISSGNKLTLNILLINNLILSIFFEKKIPIIIPEIVERVPIKNPTKKNIFLMEELVTPIDFSIAISLVLFLTNIVNPEIILNAAINIISGLTI